MGSMLAIYIPESVNLYDEADVKIIIDMFEKAVDIFKPFYGCVSNVRIYNKHIARKNSGQPPFIYKGKPSTVHWLNYWSEEIADCIGFDKIKKVLDEHRQISFDSGIFKIKNCALDAENESDMEFHKLLDRELGLR